MTDLLLEQGLGTGCPLCRAIVTIVMPGGTRPLPNGGRQPGSPGHLRHSRISSRYEDGLEPDLFVLGKSIGSVGVPFAAYGMTDEIAALIEGERDHGRGRPRSTRTPPPLGCTSMSLALFPRGLREKEGDG
jgi:hypothetical protein